MTLPRHTISLLLVAGCTSNDIHWDPGPEGRCLESSDYNTVPASGATVEFLLQPWVDVRLTTQTPGIEDVVLSGFGTQRSSRNAHFDAACGLDPVFTVQVDADLDVAGTSYVGSLELVTNRGPGDTDESTDRAQLDVTLDANSDLDAWLPTQHSGFTGPSSRSRATFILEPGEPAVLRVDVVDAMGENWIVLSDAAVLQP